MKMTPVFACLCLLLTEAWADRTPWTHQNFQNDPDEFHFAIIPDRTGYAKNGRGAFTNALAKINLLRPEFVMCVGDLIQSSWVPAPRIRQQQDELTNLLAKVKAPFYVTVGNHDITSTAPTRPNGNEISTAVWKEYFGDSTYYSFVYKNVLFVVLNTMEGHFGPPEKQVGITPAQYAWFKQTLDQHPVVRWTYIFMHAPSVWDTRPWIDFENKELLNRRYTVFAGDRHQCIHARRNGHDYYQLGVVDGVSEWNWTRNHYTRTRTYDENQLLGPEYGEMDHITWVTMTHAGPVVAHLQLSGIFPGEYLNQINTKSPSLTSVLDVPSTPQVLKRVEENRKLKEELIKSAERR